MQLKSLTPKNLDHIVESLKPLYGFRFQEVQTSDQDVLIGLWGKGDLHWLFFDLQIQRPMVFLLPDPSPVKIKTKDKPLKLFLKAHAVGLTFVKVERKQDEGRILRLYFESPKSPEFNCEIEARLFPHGQNIIVKSKGKTISFDKVQPLQASSISESVQSLDDAFAQWLQQRMPKAKSTVNLNESTKNPGVVSQDPSEVLKNKLLEKKRKAIIKVELELKEKSANQYQELGEWLKANQILKVPKSLEDLIDKKKSLNWNMEEAFRKSKQFKDKIARTKERLEELKSELLEIEQNKLPQAQTQQKTKSKTSAEYKGRLLKLTENLEARAGKSGADNLALLRQARAWDFWLHLKDLPGSHAILFRNKNQKVTDHDLRKVASWLVELSLKKATKDSGEKYQVLVTECRFVRPIKGDKLGRVNYQNERVLAFQYPYT